MRSGSATKLIGIGEIGTDADEIVATILACQAVREGYLEVLAFIANHVKSLERARNAKQIFMALGQGDTPVGMGERGFGSSSVECEEDPRYLAHPTRIGHGRVLLKWTLEHAEDNSVVLALNSGFTDAVWLWMDDPGLFLRKVRRVVLMSGIQMDGDHPRLSDEGFLVPSIGKGGAANNNFDPGSTMHLFDAMQRHNVPMTITTRFAAYGCMMPYSIFDAMAKTGSPIGVRLYEQQATRLRELWAKANAEVGSFERGDLPARCDRNWFMSTFCGGRDPGDDDVLPYMAEVAWYDPMNYIASSDELRAEFYRPYELEMSGATHQVIGLTQQNHGVIDPPALRQFMAHSVIETLRLGQTPRLVF